jgi:hypothetical protein
MRMKLWTALALLGLAAWTPPATAAPGRGGALPCPDPVGQGRWHQGGGPSWIVVAAPHEGFDRNTGPLAVALAESLGARWVIADGLQGPEGRWNVNRPTLGAGLRPEDEAQNLASRSVHQAYRAALLGPRHRLLIEIHGNRRPASAHWIELAHQGFEPSWPGRFQASWAKRLLSFPAGMPRLPLGVEGLNPIHYQARAAKAIGVFRDFPLVLQLEFPWALRATPELRQAYGRALGLTLKELLPSPPDALLRP